MAARDRQDLEWHTGSQGSACLNNRPYRRYVRRILREVARRFARNEHIFAWQIDNSIATRGGGPCYCDDCEQAFREWLRRRYGTIERLNKLWGTVFWSQEFADWHLVPAPRRTPGGPHPSLALDYDRFISATVRDFVDEQKKLLGEYAREPVTVTTNVARPHRAPVDMFSLASAEDVVSVDNMLAGQVDLGETALNLDVARAAAGGEFWVLKQRAGAMRRSRGRRQNLPGQLRLWAFQAAARGASMLNFYRWRSVPFGQEMSDNGLLDAYGNELRGMAELRDAIAELRRHGPVWQDRMPEAQVAMVLDYSALWAAGPGGGAAGLRRMPDLARLHGALRAMGQPVDIIDPRGDIAGYAAVIAPMALVSREQVATRWTQYVQQGGVVLATGPVGLRTEYNTAATPAPPGAFADLFGAVMDEYDLLGSQEGRDAAVLWDGERYPAQAFLGRLRMQGADPLATWDDALYGEQPALSINRTGQGAAVMFAGHSDTAFYRRLVERVMQEAGLEPHSWASQTTEVIPLRAAGDGADLTFVLNHAADGVALELPPGEKRTDLLTGTLHADAVPVPGFGVVLLQG
jgi:beta-galactosidase